jgi:hypothetical protein
MPEISPVMIRKSFRPSMYLAILLASVLAIAPTASSQATEQVLYSFQGIPDGSTPVGGIVFDKKGNLYGATADGGASTCYGPGQCGTVF